MNDDVEDWTLRDYFAATAKFEDLNLPTTLKECAEYLGLLLNEYNNKTHWYQILTTERYRYADAMLEARKK